VRKDEVRLAEWKNNLLLVAKRAHAKERAGLLVADTSFCAPNVIRTASTLLSAFLISCANDPPIPTLNSSSSSSLTGVAADTINALPGVRSVLHYKNFYSLAHPHPITQCAGDAQIYFHPWELAPETSTSTVTSVGVRPSPLPIAQPAAALTHKAPFVQNISVDITDANSPAPQNRAFACSLGTSASVPKSSSCATFDYGAVGGIPTALGGTMILMGGIQGLNYTGIAETDPSGTSVSRGHTLSCGTSSQQASPTDATQCDPSMMVLAVENLPADTATSPASALAPGITLAAEPISTWRNIAGTSGYLGPNGGAGSVAAYSPSLQKILFFSGSAPLPGQLPTGRSSANSDTWIFDLQKQAWSQIETQPLVDPRFLTQSDYDTTQSTIRGIPKPRGARALFGYTPTIGWALSKFTSGVNGATVSSAERDTTERLLITGGVGPMGVYTDSLRFNPTFGPELLEASTTAAAGTLVGVTADVTTATYAHQGIESYHTSPITNYVTTSNLYPNLYPYDGTQNKILNFGYVPLLNTSATATTNTGYLMALGGFLANSSKNTPSISATPAGVCVSTGDLTKCGGMTILGKYGTATALSAANDALPGHFAPFINLLDNNFLRASPATWYSINETTYGSVPWYGGAVTLPGISRNTNDIVYVGGTDCKNYMTDVTAACNFNNAGVYWRLGQNPITSLTAGAALTRVAMSAAPSGGEVPVKAGMAAARGKDAIGNTIIVAWGGTNSAGIEDTTSRIHFLSQDSATSTLRWGVYTPTAGISPPGLINAAMTYSHITRKFYLFGGHTPTVNRTRNDTWELSVSGDCSTGSCTFAWRQLNGVGGKLSCYPATCPPARRSHRMAEVNYNAPTEAAEPDCTSPTAPCSFGIFMEGGTPDGVSYHSDRWMFDPSANDANGHWQLVNEFPARVASAMAYAEYAIPNRPLPARRAILYGGETGLSNPNISLTLTGSVANYFVAPTLGDTWVFDFDNSSWNRVRLLGRGYSTSAAAITVSGGSQNDVRQAYSVGAATDDDRRLAVLTPPPLSGAVMVSRTQSAGSSGGTTLKPLRTPEIFLFGGRLKDGRYHTLKDVYKLCVGSPGEKPSSISPDDATCDSFDPDENPASAAPVQDYVGRWLFKEPSSNIDLTQLSLFMGAGAYDPIEDRIILQGGLQSPDPTPSSTPVSAVTDPGTDTSPRFATYRLYEFTPPKKLGSGNPSDSQGILNEIPYCMDSNGTEVGAVPPQVYGHQLAYDTLTRQLVLVGGYDSDGQPLLTTKIKNDGSTYSLPRVYTAKRISANQPADSALGLGAIVNSPCYLWKQLSTFGNSTDVPALMPSQKGIAHAAAVFVPASGYNTGYYATQDNACVGSGSTSSSDATVNRLFAGGVYIDLDRSKTLPGENLLLNLTFLPLGTGQLRPDAQRYLESEQASFRIHLVRTGKTLDDLMRVPQPRHLVYNSTDRYPRIAHTLSIVAPPTGEARQEQVVLPISIDPNIDQIRIERYSGSAILIDVGVFRLGSPDALKTFGVSAAPPNTGGTGR
jgi:hypothetical protein